MTKLSRNAIIWSFWHLDLERIPGIRVWGFSIGWLCPTHPLMYPKINMGPHTMPRRQPSIGPVPPPGRDVRGVLDSIRRVVRVLRVGSRDAEKKVGLSGAQLFVLQKLSETKTLSVNELAERTHTHQSSVSVVVQRLVDQGLAARKKSPKDARQVRLSVTRAGRTILRSAPAAAPEQLIDALSRMRLRSWFNSPFRSNVCSICLASTPASRAMFFEDDHNGRTGKRS